MQYVFTAVFSKDADQSLLVSFPDLPGCCTAGANMLTAAKKAEAILTLCLFDMEQQGIAIPEARYPGDITLNDGEITSMVVADTAPYHLRFGKSTTKHTFYMPAWFEQVANTSHLDLSRILQDAVRREIGMPVRQAENPETDDHVDTSIEQIEQPDMPEPAAETALVHDVATSPVKPAEKPLVKPKEKPSGNQVAIAVMIGLVCILVVAAVLLSILTFTNWLDDVRIVRTFVEYIEARTPINFNIGSVHDYD